MAAVFPPLVGWPVRVFESVFWTLGLALALVVSHMLEQRGPATRRWAFWSGVATGGAVMFRAATSPFVGLLTLWLIWKRQWTALAAVWIGLLIVLTPWTIRNYYHFNGRLVVIASDGGVTFWTGNNPLATGEGDMAANPVLKFANKELRAKYPELNEEAFEPIYYRESLVDSIAPARLADIDGEESVLPRRPDRAVISSAFEPLLRHERGVDRSSAADGDAGHLACRASPRETHGHVAAGRRRRGHVPRLFRRNDFGFP
jgi:hypothetical protein